MNSKKLLTIAAVLAIFLTVIIIVQTIVRTSHFNAVVKESYVTTEGYDQKFISMVNRLEEVLALRASFGYLGGKDPMTGLTRNVVQQKAQVQYNPATGKVVKQPENRDPFKLTAIIYDEYIKSFTAVVMMVERSYSVEVGDIVGDRKVLQISKDGIYLEGPSMFYFYDIQGNRSTKPK